MSPTDSAAQQEPETKQKIESKPVVENKAAAERKGKPLKLWILAGAGALILMAAVAAFLIFPSIRSAPASLWARKAGGGGAQKHEQVKAALPLEPFLVNLADTDEIHFVKTTFQLGCAEEPGEEATGGVAIAAIRDSIISLLSTKKAEQILTPQGKAVLRQEIRTRVNALVPEMKVLEVYIVDFVVQL